MESLKAAYCSDEEEDADIAPFSSSLLKAHSTAPSVNASAHHQDGGAPGEQVSSRRVVYYNPRAKRMFPRDEMAGPAATARQHHVGFFDRERNHRSGHVEVNYTSSAAFDVQYASFVGKGYAIMTSKNACLLLVTRNKETHT